MKNKNIIIIALILVILLLTSCKENTINKIDLNINDGILEIHFIDVGQGDSTYIKYPNGENLLIDGGSKSKANILIDYLEKQGVNEINTIIGTHPHEDHIGSLPEVIRSFKVNNIYLPRKTSNTNIFEELLLEIKKNNISLKEGKAGLNIISQKDFSVDLLWPDIEYKNTNNNSIITKISYGNISTMVMGDAEREVEESLLTDINNMKSDILRVGHHGSNTSSSLEFIKKVNPVYSVISVGEGNKYKHPDLDTIENLEKIKTNILRTDLDGNIVFYIDGKNIELNKSPSININLNNRKKLKGNINTKVFHTLSCKSAPNEENIVYFANIEEAIEAGYRPHKNCVK